MAYELRTVFYHEKPPVWPVESIYDLNVPDRCGVEEMHFYRNPTAKEVRVVECGEDEKGGFWVRTVSSPN